MRAPPPAYPTLKAALRAIWADPIAYGEAMGYRGDAKGRKRFGPVHHLIVKRVLNLHRSSTRIPRNCGKSTLISVIIPSWKHLRDPSIRTMLGSSSQSLAKELIGEIREMHRGDLEFTLPTGVVSIPLIRLFPHMEPAGSSQKSGPCDYLDIVGKSGKGREHSFFPASPESSITGKHPPDIVVDDPCDFKNTRTFDQRQKGNRWFLSLEPILYSPECPIAHVGTIWAPNDTSQAIEDDGSYDVLNLPAWVPENPETGIADGLGPGPLPDGRWAERFKGCYPLCPSFLNVEELHEKERQSEALGQPHFFAAQYLNIPSVSADAIFPDQLILDATWPDIPDFAGYPELLLWDPTGRITGSQGDANGLVIVQPVPAKAFSDATDRALSLEPDRNVFIVRYARQVNGGVDDALQVVERICSERPALKAIWIEDVVAQAAIAPWLKERGNIEGVRVRGQKIGTAKQSARLQGLATAMRDGQVILPAEFEGRDRLIRQLTEYPASDYDDLPCAAALLGQHRERRGSLPGVPGPTFTEGDPESLWPSQLGVRGTRRSWP